MVLDLVTTLLAAGMSSAMPGPTSDVEIRRTDSVADASMQRQGNRVRRFEDSIDRITLLNMALWSILKEKLGVSDDELLKRVEEIDLSDGKLDGKVRVQVTVCPHCNRQMSCKFLRCLYCGYTIPNQNAVMKVMAGPPVEEKVPDTKTAQGKWGQEG